MALTKIKTGGITDSAITTAKINNDAVTDAKVADAITITGAQTGITSVGTLSSLTLGGDLLVPQYIKHVGDTDCHIEFGTDEVKLRTGDSSRLIARNSDVEIYSPLVATSATFSGQVLVPDGSAGTPSISNTGDGNTGLYFNAADEISITLGGTQLWRYSGQQQGALQGANPGYPAYSFATDWNTGMYLESADTLAFSTGGTKRLNIDSSGNATFAGNIILDGSSSRQIEFKDSSESEGAIVFDEITDGFVFKVGGTSGSSKIDAFKIAGDGNCGVGVTPEDWDTANNFKVLQAGTGAWFGGSGTAITNSQSYWGNNCYYDDVNNRWEHIGNSEATLFHQNDDGHLRYYNASAASDDSAVSFNTRFVIRNNGKAGFGVDDPSTKLHVFEDSSDYACLIQNNQGDGKVLDLFASSSDDHAADHLFIARTDAKTLFTIGNDGAVGIGNSSPSTLLDASGDYSGFIFAIKNDGNNSNRSGMRMQCGTDDQTGTVQYIAFQDGNNDETGVLKATGATVALHDTSDIRLKKDIVDTAIDGLSMVNDMKVRDFVWKKNGMKATAGFIANELAEVCPHVVDGEPDALHEDGRIKAMTITKENMVPVLVKAIQELSAKVIALEGN